MTKPNFVDDLELWLPSDVQNTSFHIFEKYTLKVQFSIVTEKPEMVVTYEGQSRVFKKSMDELMNHIAPDHLNWMIFESRLFRYNEMPDEARRNLSSVFPVLNFDIRNDLQLATEAPDRGNPYLKYKQHIELFRGNYLDKEEFKKVLPVSAKSFVKVQNKHRYSRRKYQYPVVWQ